MLELKALCEKAKELFDICSIDELGDKLMACVIENDTEKFEKFEEIVEDLSTDWLQKIYQYYQADRKEKMQDYTPKSLAMFVGMLVGKADVVVDMCAGSGALTIQKWNESHSQKFNLYEFDKNVIPYLLFNMAVRNIDAVVYQSDVLQGEIFKMYVVRPSEKYSTVKEIKNA